MACPPKPAPAGVRRLSELLAEQQEPFSLDAYLLQKGYPERSLPEPLCWSILSTGHGLHRIRNSRFQLLKRKLVQLLHPKASSSGDNDNRKAFLKNDTSAVEEDDHDHLCSPPSLQWKGWEAERSPVSVLDLSSSEGDSSCSCVFFSMTDEDETKDLDGFKELLELASSPACNSLPKSRKQLDDPKKLVLDYEKDEIASAITSINQLTFQPHTREIGTHVEEAIFEAVILETISFCCT